MHCAQVRYALLVYTKQQILAIVEAAVREKQGPTATVSPGWWYSFMSRHPKLTFPCNKIVKKKPLSLREREVSTRR